MGLGWGRRGSGHVTHINYHYYCWCITLYRVGSLDFQWLALMWPLWYWLHCHSQPPAPVTLPWTLHNERYFDELTNKHQSHVILAFCSRQIRLITITILMFIWQLCYWLFVDFMNINFELHWFRFTHHNYSLVSNQWTLGHWKLTKILVISNKTFIWW